MQQAATFHYRYIYIIIQFFKAQGKATGGRYDVKISAISLTHIPVENVYNFSKLILFVLFLSEFPQLQDFQE